MTFFTENVKESHCFRVKESEVQYFTSLHSLPVFLLPLSFVSQVRSYCYRLLLNASLASLLLVNSHLLRVRAYRVIALSSIICHVYLLQIEFPKIGFEWLMASERSLCKRLPSAKILKGLVLVRLSVHSCLHFSTIYPLAAFLVIHFVVQFSPLNSSIASLANFLHS